MLNKIQNDISLFYDDADRLKSIDNELNTQLRIINKSISTISLRELKHNEEISKQINDINKLLENFIKVIDMPWWKRLWILIHKKLIYKYILTK